MYLYEFFKEVKNADYENMIYAFKLELSNIYIEHAYLLKRYIEKEKNEKVSYADLIRKYWTSLY